MKKLIFLIIIFLSGVFSMTNAQDNLGDKALKFKSSYDETEQPYRLFIPDTYDKKSKSPLLVVLHGKWVDQNAWFDFTPVKKYADKFGYIVAAPFGRGDYFYRGAGEQDVLDIIAKTKNEFSVDDEKVYLMGHSMGGWGTWWLGLRNPDMFATIAPMAGMPPVDWLINAEHLDPFIIHSDDDPIVFVKNSRIPAAKLSELGISHRYKEERNYGHNSSLIGDNFPLLFEWMNNHKINKSPKRINFTTRTPAKGKAYWINILETINYPKFATVKAQISVDEKTKEQSLSVKTENIKRIAFDASAMPIERTAPLKFDLDGVELKIEAGQKLTIFCRDSADAKWREPKNEEETITEFKSPVIAEIPKDAPELKDPRLLSNAASKHLLEALKDKGVELCLFRFDMFMTPGGKLTADDIVDLYVFCEERLGIIEYKGEELPIYLNEKPEFFPQSKIDVDGLKSGKVKSYKVVAPIDILDRMGMKYEILPELTGEYLLKSVSAKKQFLF